MIRFDKGDGSVHEMYDDSKTCIGYATFFTEMPREFSLFDEADMENEFDAGVAEGHRDVGA